jgi:hypothetical protein
MHIDIERALSGKYATAWRKAIRSELASLHSKGTFRKENLPLGRNNVIGSKWVFKVKGKPDGSVNRFEARLLAHQGSITRMSRLLRSIILTSCQAQHLADRLNHSCQAKHSHAIGRHRNYNSQHRPPKRDIHAPTFRKRMENASSNAHAQEHLWTKASLT